MTSANTARLAALLLQLSDRHPIPALAGSDLEDVEPRLLLVQYLRDVLGFTGTNVGCDTTNCGACTVHLDGRSVKSCTVLAVQADGERAVAGGDDHRRADERA